MTTHTPMMKQYLQLKAHYADCLLFYRMGDFFELFADDAEIASDILNITLTRRRTSKNGDEGIPMCGVPHHAAEGYIAKLITAGHKVALCEQVETPEEAKKRGGSGALVKRDVVRIYTAGTLTEDNLLEAHTANFTVALYPGNSAFTAVAWLDISTGHCGVTHIPHTQLNGVVSALNPREVICPPEQLPHYSAQLPDITITPWDTGITAKTATQKLYNLYNVATLDAFGTFVEAEIIALAYLMAYAELTQLGKMPPLHAPHHRTTAGELFIDNATRTHLELTQSQRGGRKGSLLGTIDHTVTAAGGRLLHDWLSTPLTQLDMLNDRYNAISTLRENATISEDMCDTLKHTTDCERALSRLMLDRGSPRDMGLIRQTLHHLPPLLQYINSLKTSTPLPLLQEACATFNKFDDLAHTLNTMLKDTDPLPPHTRDGGYIAAGADKQLDAYRALATGGTQQLHAYEKQESEAANLPLKLKYNKVWGYFFEVTKSQLDKVPSHFIHRQTTTNAQRFVTPTLVELEKEISAASTNALAREHALFAELLATIRTHVNELQRMAQGLATLDVLLNGAYLAQKHNYTRPTLTEGTELQLKNARHPVVERTVESFTPNTITLTDTPLWLLTGPNMAGKSTILRQTAICVILAQMGYFVPAEEATIGVVDKLFSRIGASDDVTHGKSTFMVEMVETAAILNNATEKSLVILDEIGRGTATYDGLAIAWACVEHLVLTNACRGIFATHYHELTQLAHEHATIANYHVAVKEWKGDIVFLHQLKEGSAPRSYGVQVAKLAGLPPAVIQRAQHLLQGLEKTAQGGVAVNPADLPLFTAPTATPSVLEKPLENPVNDKLVSIDLDSLSPRDAQNLLYDLKIMANSTR